MRTRLRGCSHIRTRSSGQEFVDFDAGVADISETTVRVLLQTSPQQLANAKWDTWRKCRPVNLPLEDTRDRVRDGLASEGSTTGEHLEDDTAKRPDVRPLIQSPPPSLFGTHISRRSENRPLTELGGRHGWIA